MTKAKQTRTILALAVALHATANRVAGQWHKPRGLYLLQGKMREQWDTLYDRLMGEGKPPPKMVQELMDAIRDSLTLLGRKPLDFHTAQKYTGHSFKWAAKAADINSTREPFIYQLAATAALLNAEVLARGVKETSKWGD